MADYPKITIGVPVYNGEKFIQKCLESVLKQTRTDFELLISDNASTDKTSEICKKNVLKDKRIRYIRQRKNLGALNNFRYLLKEAKGEYFAFLAVDNYYQDNYLDKCISTLDTSKEIVGVMGKLKIDENYHDVFSKEKKMLKKIGLSYRPIQEICIEGNYNRRIKTWLKNIPWQLFYSVYRTEVVRKGDLNEFFVGSDGAFMLSILKFGGIRTISDTTFVSFPYGESINGTIQSAIKINPGLVSKIFPFYPLTKWCIKNLGIKNCLKNSRHIIRLNFDGVFLYLKDLYVFFKKKSSLENMDRL